ncbi:ciliogenesis-associated TTC17-interacting protein-like [Aphis craccivora]|uniref:Ciliogenesis-associated TTC17-interacting protein-like n=1 Tax=Aphis craccivora TaxID=307492 RepID=A0A6G0YMF4_APHCR|nr:ciliogenesis-associated TTC17-interacting protein-like [Aphis craccivora]
MYVVFTVLKKLFSINRQSQNNLPNTCNRPVLHYDRSFLAVTRHTMSFFYPSSQLSKTIKVILAKLLLLFAVLFCVKQDFGVGSFGSDQWVRLCTLMSNGSSLINVTMPCEVQVKSDELKDDPKYKTDVSESWREVDDSPEYVKITLDDDRNTKATIKSPNIMTTKQDSNPNIKYSGNKISEGDLEEEVDIEGGGIVQEEGSDVQEEGDADVYVEDDNDDRDIETDSVDNDKDQSTYDEEALNVGVNGSVSEEKEDDISDVRDQLKNQRCPNAVTKVMLGYLLNARSQLYEKINYLLNLLQRTFFNRKLNCRRRRNSIELPSLLNNKRKQENKKNPSLSSVILEPTFERSMMTMSFLMFGVFVIQVIQKLMETMQQPSETSFMGNSIFGNLLTLPSDIF